MPAKVNPLEELVEELSEAYVEMVYDLVEQFAPARPWWAEELTDAQQLWRWMDAKDEEGVPIRDVILGWLMAAGAAMGYADAEESLEHIEEYFTSPAAIDRIPPAVVAEIPYELLEMVQASSPEEAAAHIRKMESLLEDRAVLMDVIGAPESPKLPVAPAPLPIELLQAGWPLYGGSPQGRDLQTL